MRFFSSETPFSADYDLDFDLDYPGTGQWPVPSFAYDDDGSIVDDPVVSGSGPRVINVRAHGGLNWVGSFTSGDHGATGTYPTPSPHHLCVVTAGLALLVDVDEPSNGATIVQDDVQHVAWLAHPALLLLATSSSLFAVGAAGVAWTAKHVVHDDLTVTSTTSAMIWCTGTVLDYRPGELGIDPLTGQVRNGPHAS